MITLIVADDHTVLRQALAEMLTAHGKCSVVGQAGSGEELLTLLETQNPDAIVIDVEMPGMGGLAAIERIKASGRNIPILVLAADDGQKNVRAALKAGANGFVPKNAGAQELEFAISAVLQGKTYLSPNVTASLMNDDNTAIDAANPLARLTERELEIFKHLADGKPNREIGQMLHISTRTVDTHRSNILKKLGVRTNAELVKLAISAGVIKV